MIIGLADDVLFSVFVEHCVVSMPHPSSDGKLVAGESIRANQRLRYVDACLPVKLSHARI